MSNEDEDDAMEVDESPAPSQKKPYHKSKPPSFDAAAGTLTIYHPMLPLLQCPISPCETKVPSTTVNKNGSTVNRSAKLAEHIGRVHTNVTITTKSHYCLICPKDISSEHYQLNHICNQSYYVPNDDVPLPFECLITVDGNICGFKHRSKQGLSNHQRTHKGKPKQATSSIKPIKKPKIGGELVQSCSTATAGPSTLPEVKDEEENLDVDDEDLMAVGGPKEQPEMEIDLPEDYSITQAQPELDWPSLIEKWNSELYDLRPSVESTVERWAKFEEIAAKITLKVQEHLNIDTTWRKEQAYFENEDMNQTQLRKLYHRNPKRVMNIINKTKNLICNEDLNVIHNHFTTKLNEEGPPIDESYFKARPEYEETPQWVPLNSFTQEEVIARLKKFRNTAPGPDKIQYIHWLTVDPKGELLSSIFNICRAHRKIPSVWKSSITFLFAKNEAPASLTEWRPISLLPTLYKVYSALISQRIRKWCEEYNIIHLSQKGGSQYDVILEHTFLIDYIIRRAKTTQKSACFAFLDIKDAFPSTPTKAVLKSLEVCGAGVHIGNIVRNILTNRSTVIIAGKGTTDIITMKKGVLMGDPISSILFTLVLNHAIIELNKMTPIPEIPRPIFADVDDLAVVSTDPKDLQKKVTKIEKSLKKIHLTLSHQKCKALHVCGEVEAGTRDISIKVNKEQITFLQETWDHHTYIGVEIGYNKPTEFKPLEKFGEYVKKIMMSKLSGCQKIDAVKRFIMPKLNHHLRFSRCNRGDWDHFDNYLRGHIKDALAPNDILRNAPGGYIYGPRKYACLSLNNCRDDFEIAKVTNAFKLLKSPDPIVQRFAVLDLSNSCRSKEESPEDVITDQDRMDFLNKREDHGTSSNQSVWTLARFASKTLNITWSVEFDEDDENDEDAECDILLQFYNQYVDVSNPKLIMRNLRQLKRREHYEEAKSTIYGSALPVFSKSAISNHFLSDYRNSLDWYFVHAARLNLSRVRASAPLKHAMERVKKKKNPDYDSENDPARFCRNCKGMPSYGLETVCHVLNACESHLSTHITDRHNSIIDLFKKAINMDIFEIISEDQMLPETPDLKRPDLLVVQKNEKELYVIDMACPFENYDTAENHKKDEDKVDSLTKKANEKIEKYDQLGRDWLETDYNTKKYKCTHSQVVPIIVGSRGAWYPPNDEWLKIFIPNKGKRIRFAKDCVTTVIHWSRCIMLNHLGNRPIIHDKNGYPQNEENPNKDSTPSNNPGPSPQLETTNDPASSNAPGPSSEASTSNVPGPSNADGPTTEAVPSSKPKKRRNRKRQKKKPNK